jgi:hypothetical protein
MWFYLRNENNSNTAATSASSAKHVTMGLKVDFVHMHLPAYFVPDRLKPVQIFSIK